MNRARQAVFWLVLISFPVLVPAALFALCELGVRAYIAAHPSSTVPSGVQHPPYYYRPNNTIPSYASGFYGPAKVNSLGLRGPETTVTKPAGIKRILFLGDSVVNGALAADDRTLAALMQAQLDSRGGQKWEVINGGVGGYDFWDYAGFLKLKGLAFQPDIVILGVCQNDNVGYQDYKKVMTPEHAPAQTLRWKIRTALSSSKALGWLNEWVNVHRRAKGQTFASRKPIPDDVKARLEKTLHGDSQSAAALVRFLEDYRFYPYLAEDTLSWSLDLDRWRQTREPLAEIESLCRKNHVELIGFTFPLQFELYPGYRYPEPDRTIGGNFRSLHVPYYDARGALSKVPNGDELYPKRYDIIHPSAKAYEIIEQGLVEQMDRLGWLAGGTIPRQP